MNKAVIEHRFKKIKHKKAIVGSEEGNLPLLKYVVKDNCTLDEAYGNRTIWTKYTKTNCQRFIDNLQPYLDSEDPEIVEYAQSAIAFY
ncbi:MAG: hypothetical protein MR283_01370 [Erysipelotrichaceae bacterium]|nr:hypothetical protein [Erysipelotrichaceae bacterium]